MNISRQMEELSIFSVKGFCNTPNWVIAGGCKNKKRTNILPRRLEFPDSGSGKREQRSYLNFSEK